METKRNESRSEVYKVDKVEEVKRPQEPKEPFPYKVEEVSSKIKKMELRLPEL